MDDLAALITAVGSLITAIGGVLGIILANRRSNRQAAEAAASEVDDQQSREIAELKERLRKLAGEEPRDH